MHLALAQVNPTIGDLAGNLNHLVMVACNAHEVGATLLIAPELVLCGYPPQDLLERPAFICDCLCSLCKLVELAPMPMVVGSVMAAKGDPIDWAQGALANAAIFIANKEILARHHKSA